MAMFSRTLLTTLFLIPTALTACASNDETPFGDDPTSTTSGGTTSTGGASSTGGAIGSGGSATGGTTATGGAGGTGGISSGGTTTGGTDPVGDGGTTSTGGSETGGASTGGAAGEEAFNPCPTNGDPCKVLPFGDSITFGVGSTDEGGYRSRLFALTHAANEKMTFVGSQMTGPAQVAGVSFPRNHEGRSGWTIEPGFSDWAGGISSLVPSPAFNTAPHIVLLMIGTNDVNASQGQGTMINRLGSLVDKVVMAAPDALIVLAQITPLGWSPQALSNYNAAIPGFVDTRAAQGQHIIRVDMSTMPKSGLDSDNIHPNNQGYEFMAGVWHDAIKEFLPH